MATFSQIEALGHQIGTEFNAQQVILFGSHAHGTADDDSDVDILVVMGYQGKAWQTATKIRHRVHPRFPVDLLVRTPEQVRQRLDMGDCFIREITDNGKILYETSDR